MDRERCDEWVVRVVDWHNRHPLARCVALAAALMPIGSAAAAAVAALAPRPAFVEAEVTLGRVEMPVLKPHLEIAGKTAAHEAAAALRKRAQPPAAAFALLMRRMRTHAESEMMLPLLKSSVASSGAPAGLRVDVMPAGDDWRAVAWPFMRREDAERLRDQLLARGQVVEIISF